MPLPWKRSQTDETDAPSLTDRIPVVRNLTASSAPERSERSAPELVATPDGRDDLDDHTPGSK